MGDKMKRTEGLIREILGDSYFDLWVDRYVFEEELNTHEGRIVCELHHQGSGQPEVIEGQGVGIIDAVFSGLKNHLAKDYPSLDTIRFVGFTVRGAMETGKAHAGTDALGEVVLEVLNTRGTTFEFRDKSTSVTGSSIIVTLHAVEYFVNSERAFIQSYKALQDAKGRSRQDLVDVYTRHLAELVRNTSYSRVIEEIQSTLDG